MSGFIGGFTGLIGNVVGNLGLGQLVNVGSLGTLAGGYLGYAAGGIAGTAIAAAAGAVFGPAFLRPRRAMDTFAGLIIPDCVIEEVGRDDLVITEHPVEFGSVIADHAFKRPREVTLRWAWSNSDPRHPSESFVREMYSQLLIIQDERVPFSLYTGKCGYENMLIASLGQTTNASSEYTLNTVIVCREVIITYTEPGNVQQSSLVNPSTNAPMVNSGAQQLNSISSAVTAPGFTAGAPGVLSFNPGGILSSAVTPFTPVPGASAGAFEFAP